MPQPHPNGSTKLVWVLLTFAIATLLSVAGAWAYERNSNDKELAARCSELEKNYVLINRNLADVNAKLDKLIEAQER